MWSWAVTSLRLFGRLQNIQYALQWIYASHTHYFSTHGWSLVFSLVGAAFEEAPLAASAFLALRSKKLAMMSIGVKLCVLTSCCLMYGIWNWIANSDELNTRLAFSCKAVAWSRADKQSMEPNATWKLKVLRAGSVTKLYSQQLPRRPFLPTTAFHRHGMDISAKVFKWCDILFYCIPKLHKCV